MMLAAHVAIPTFAPGVYYIGWALAALTVFVEALRGRWSRGDWPLYMLLGALWPLLVVAGPATWLLDHVLSPWAERRRERRWERARARDLVMSEWFAARQGKGQP